MIRCIPLPISNHSVSPPLVLNCRLLVLVQAGYQFNKVTWETHLLHGSPKLRMADTIKGFAVIYKEIERGRDRENVCVPYTFR